MDVAERIGEANEKFKEAIRTADGDVIPSLYTADAVDLPPNAEAVSGQKALTQYWESFFQLGITDARPVTGGGAVPISGTSLVEREPIGSATRNRPIPTGGTADASGRR